MTILRVVQSVSIVVLLLASPAVWAGYVEGTDSPGSFALTRSGRALTINVDAQEFVGVVRAAQDLADDVGKVTGTPATLVRATEGFEQRPVLVGTIGKSRIIDGLIAAGKLDVSPIVGKWEAHVTEVVANPLPGVEQALLIAGSDKRGTIYGIYELSEQMGVSPWYWWADVPPHKQNALYVKAGTYIQGPPAVKYCGIFINDEDWGLNPWAAKTFDPEFKNIGPKTYEKVFELMLRLRLNYIWPAMHRCTTEFGSVPENVKLADKYGIVAGASHCEPMLYNNVHWDPKTLGPWDYSSANRDKIHSLWEETAKTRGSAEAVWTIGIRGIHDAPMNGPKDMPGRMSLLSKVIDDQRSLLDQYVSKQWGPVAQCFVPYK